MKHDPKHVFAVQHVKRCVGFEYVCNGQILPEAAITN